MTRWSLRRSIFIRLFLQNIMTALVCVFIIAAMMFSFLGNYAFGRRENVLNQSLRRVCDIAELALNEEGSVSPRFFFSAIASISAASNLIILVIDVDGNIIAASPNAQSLMTSTDVNPAIFERTLKGDDVRSVGRFYGIFNTDCLTIGSPIRTGGIVAGAVYVAVTVPELVGLRSDVLKMFATASLVAVIVTAVLTYFFSRRLVYPLKIFNKAARSIAGGDLARRVEVIGNDEISELAQSFNHMAESLENTDRMRETFIANVSHELRTPLTTISGFIEGILDGTIEQAEQRKYLGVVLDETYRLSRMVTQMLSIVRLKNQSHLDVRVFDINELLRLALIKFEQRINEKKLDVSVDFQQELCRVAADKDAYEQIIFNLMDNALKFVNEGGYLKISVRADRDVYVVGIENSGDGIHPSKMNKIWDRFFKADPSRSRNTPGMGLGLYIVRTLLSAHDQKIRCLGEQGQYVRFEFTAKKIK